jgi:O-methyltransferase
MSHEVTPAKMAIRAAARVAAKLTRARRPMGYPPYPATVAQRIERYHDDVRYATFALAVDRLQRDNIPGAFAEIGVYRGVTSAFIRLQAPERRFYLFDTFEGFPEQSLEHGADTRFKDTSQEGVAAFIGDTTNIEFRKGFFPATAAGLEGETFALVILDVDLYLPALDVLAFFYPRMIRGGYFFLHDFNFPESDHAISRAAHEFLADKPELPIEICDYHGSAMFRKI